MKILWHSNAPWASTGYGQQTGLFVPRLAGLGHELAISAFYGVHGGILNWGDVPVYPGGGDAYGNDVVTAHAAHFFKGSPMDGLLICLVDAWVLNPRNLARARAAVWTPVDHTPVPPAVVEVLKQSGAVPVAMSRYGHAQLEKAELAPLFVPHGIDTTTFTPGPKEVSRKAIGLPEDRFIVGMVAANKGKPSRKSFAETMLAFARLRDHAAAVKDAPKPFLYLHTELTGMVDGLDLVQVAGALNIGPDDLLFADQYQLAVGLSPEYMANVYRSMDVLANPAMGEGFGIPIIEAQACGTPVIVADNTAQTELAAPEAAWFVQGQPYWTYQNSWQHIVDVTELTRDMRNAWERVAELPRLGEKARKHALAYDADVVTDTFWKPALDEIDKRTRRDANGDKPEVEVFTPADVQHAAEVAENLDGARTDRAAP